MYGSSSQPVPDQPKFVSAIPDYLASPRTVPARCPVGHVAPIVNNAATFSPSLSESVLFIVGAQAHAGGLAYDVLDGPRSFFAGAVEPASSSPLAPGSSESEDVTRADGPVTLDVAASTDAAGRETRAILAYFRSRAAMTAWRAAGFEKWWTDPARERDGEEGYGWFLEVLVPSADRRETIISNPEGQREGVAVLAEGTCGPLFEGGYRGASRDRLAVSQNDSLLGEGEGGPETVDPHAKDQENDSPSLVRTGRVQVRGQKNLCVIRSGQDWRGGGDEERANYPSIQRSLLHAMDDLREHARELGCHGIRFMTVLDNDVEPTDRTFGLAYFASLTQLEDWAATRPAHLDVVHRFVKYATERHGNISVRLWHEIYVLEPSMQEFEYINCAPGGGVLGVS